MCACYLLNVFKQRYSEKWAFLLMDWQKIYVIVFPSLHIVHIQVRWSQHKNSHCESATCCPFTNDTGKKYFSVFLINPPQLKCHKRPFWSLFFSQLNTYSLSPSSEKRYSSSLIMFIVLLCIHSTSLCLFNSGDPGVYSVVYNHFSSWQS